MSALEGRLLKSNEAKSTVITCDISLQSLKIITHTVCYMNMGMIVLVQSQYEFFLSWGENVGNKNSQHIPPQERCPTKCDKFISLFMATNN